MFSLAAAETSLEAPTENKFPVSAIIHKSPLLLFVLLIYSCRPAVAMFYQVGVLS